MQSSATDQVRVFDFGAHLHPERVLPAVFEKFEPYLGPHHTDVAEYARWCEQAGIDGAALSQPYYMGHDDGETTATANDALLAEIDDYDQFHGLAAIPTAAGGETAAMELERCLDEGYSGGALATKSDGIELNDPEVESVLEVAASRNAPLLVHPKLNESLHPEVLDDSYRLNAIFGREAALSESIFKVVHDGVLDRYPDLDLVFHHLGGNIAAMLGRIHLQLDPGRWPGQENLKGYEAFKTQLEERIYLDTSGFFGYPAPVRIALEELSSAQLLFGTDAPYEPRTPEEARRFADAVAGLASATDTDRILAENALELLE